MIAPARELSIMGRMLAMSYNIGRNQRGRTLRLVLTLCVLFALWHVSQHGARDVINTDNGSDCQVCRLAHAPADGGALHLTVAPVFIFAQLVPPARTFFTRTPTYGPWLARGPPSA